MSDFINKFNLIYILIFVLILTSACGGSGNKNPVVIPPPVEKPEITGISVSISGYIFNSPSVNSIKFYKTIESNTPDNSITISNSFYKIDNLPYFPEKMSFSTPAGDNVFINLRKESYELISNTKYTLRQKITLETTDENNNLINYAVLESRENSTTLSRRIMTSIDNLVENNNTIIDLFSKTPFSTISGINSAVKPVVSRRIDLEYGNMITHTIKSFDEVIKNNGENLLETFHTASKTSEQITTLNQISGLITDPQASGFITPQKVAGLTSSSITSYSAKIFWNAVSNSEYYKIYINDEFYKDGIYKTEYDLKNLYPENLYRIKVSAVNFLGEGELSDEHEFITPEFVDKTKVLQKITISRDKLVLPANGDFDLRRINVTAHYSDGNAESVSTAVWHIMNGQGSINDKIFYPTGEDGEATLRCIYTKNGITKYAFLPVEYKVAFSDPEALIISQTSHSMRVNESFNLNSVYGVILFEDGYELDVNDLIWEVVEGSGIISNNIITAGNITGDIKLVAKAYYQEFELTQEFTISILKSATGISLSHSYALVKVNFQYDLNAVKVFLNFNDGSTEEVSGHVWEVISGSGTVAGNIFTAPPSASITVLKCSYLYESELYEEEFTISNERTLHNLTLSENHILVRINTIYNLQNIGVIANYDDGSFETVNPNNVSWQKIAGRGSVSGYSFNAMSIIGNSLVRVTYEEEGVTRTADLSITIGEVPAKPSGVVCSNISSTSFNISWNTVFGADSYNLYINNILYAEQISNTSIEISDRNPGTVYYIRVSAYNQAGEGELSNQITVLTIPAQPVNVSLDSSTTTTITFSWDSVAGASEYIIFVNGSIKAAGIGTTYYTAASLLPGTSYYIQVSARNQTGEGMKSSGQMFDTKLNAPSGLSYNEITQNSFRFFWNALPGADYYRVYKDGIFYAETTENWLNIIELLPGTLYKMRVSAVKNLQEGSISYEFNTYTVPPAPTSISHVGTTSSTVSILWQAVSGASFYKLTMNDVQYGGDTTQTLMNVTGLVPGFTYDFNVYAGNTGGYSDISETISVQMLSMPPGGIVSSFLTSNGLLLTWENAFGATGYRVYIDNVLYTSTTSNTYMNITGLSPDTDYFLSVSSVNSSGEGEKSSQIHIRTLP